MKIELKNKIILYIALALIPLSGFGTDLYAPSLPYIARALQVDSNMVRLSLSIFVLGFALGQLPFGTLSDHFGRRKMLWPFLLIFAISSFLAAYVKNIEVFLLLRFIQGLVCAAPSSISKAILNDTFSGKEHAKAFSYLALCWGLSIVSAPFLGGYLQHYINWQAAFYALTIIGGLLFCAVFFVLPETLPESEHKDISFVSLFKRCRKVVSNPVFFACAGMNSVFYLFILIFSILGPFLLQDFWGYSAVFYGRMALLMGLSWVVGTYIARWLSAHFSSAQILLPGAILSTIVLIANMWVAMNVHNSVYTLIPFMMFTILMSGVIFPGMMSCAMSVFDRSLGGTAGSMLGVVTFLLSAIGSMFISHIHPSSQVPWAAVMLVLMSVNWLFIALFYGYRKKYCNVSN